MEKTYDIWKEHVGHLIRSREVVESERIFTTHTGQIANLWYYNRELLMKAFDLVKSPMIIIRLKELAMKDEDSNSPFLQAIFSMYTDIDNYECLLSGSRRAELSDKDLATAINNLGLNLCNYGEIKTDEKNLLQAYQIRKKLFPENKTAFFESCDNLSQLYLENSEPLKAVRYLDEAIKVYDTCFRPNSLEQMKCYTRRAIVEETFDSSNVLIYYDQAIENL